MDGWFGNSWQVVGWCLGVVRGVGELHRLWRDYVGIRPRYAGRGTSNNNIYSLIRTSQSHIQDLPPNSRPPKRASVPEQSDQRYKARRGRHCINLLSLLKGDLKRRGLGPLTTENKLKELRELARQKARWKEMKKD
ncbi:hypothetical protein Bbelb_026540 [Branchiostoma belcheri]|nr:hypothetical protein Bbelb_026540 [Branchiostoma belcheri]